MPITTFPMTREEKEIDLKTKLADCPMHGSVPFIKKIRSTKYFLGARWECSVCLKGGIRLRGRLRSHPCDQCNAPIYMGVLCKSCKEKLLAESKNLNRIYVENRLEEYKGYLESCEKLGTCDILKLHHEMLKKDDERLTTDFMLGLICENRTKKNPSLRK